MSSNPLVSAYGSPPRGHSRGSSRSSSPSSYRPSMARHRTRRGGSRRILSSIRKLERMICTTAKHFPLAIVYSGQTWAVYTEAYSICFTHMGGMKGVLLGTLGCVIYAMAVWSYTTAVFRDPGSPLTNETSYSHLPTSEPSNSITVKSSGTPRYCKKCQTRKPDRAHHCSTCNRCVLKMDHHCPWLATCLGLYNYKPFLLFLIYTSLLCIISFLVSASWVWGTVLNDSEGLTPGSEITPVNWILMATVSGIIGLVLSGFTIWHIMLAASGMTTIESLEKVRYSTSGLSPHNNPFAHPGNGIDVWNGQSERAREHARYNAYLDDEALGKLPHAFDLGKIQNLRDVFGTRRWAWLLPLDMSREEKARLDGWRWETSPVWTEGVQQVQRERDERMRRAQEQWIQSGNGATPPPSSSGPGMGIGGSDRTFETRHYPARHGQSGTPSSTPQRLEARSAGETPAGMVKPHVPGQGLKAIESRIRNDWAFLDEDPRFSHATSAPASSSDEDGDNSGDDSDFFDDSDGEDPANGERGGLIDHLKLRGGRARKRDIYHREMFGTSAGSGPSGRKNVAAMMGAVPSRGGSGSRLGSKVDRVLGRSKYDSDDAGEVVKMRKLKGHVPLMVAAGRVPPQSSHSHSNSQDLLTLETGKRVLGEAGEIAERMGREMVKAVAGVVDPGMVHSQEARGQEGSGVVDDWSRWGADDDEGEEMV